MYKSITDIVKIARAHGQNGAQAKRTRQARDQRRAANLTPCLKRKIDLGPEAGAKAFDYATDLYPRRKNFEAPESVSSRCAFVVVRKDSYSTYIGNCRYQRHSYPILVSSNFAHTKTQCFWFCGESSGKIKAPRGYEWSHDNLGLKLIAKSDGVDYHPNSDDLASGARHIARLIRDKRETIKIENRKIKAKAKYEKGAYLCMQDSLNVGNCRVGTVGFAKQNKLSIKKHYPVKLMRKLLEKLSSTEERCALERAINYATSRHKYEVESAKFCKLSHHYG